MSTAKGAALARWARRPSTRPAYGDGSLEDLYNELHDAFESSDYEITFDEREENDAEISFEGGGISGQVKFADECGQEGRVYVRVTARPTGLGRVGLEKGPPFG